jgi:hypothetical protein
MEELQIFLGLRINPKINIDEVENMLHQFNIENSENFDLSKNNENLNGDTLIFKIIDGIWLKKIVKRIIDGESNLTEILTEFTLNNGYSKLFTEFTHFLVSLDTELVPETINLEFGYFNHNNSKKDELIND